MNTIYLTSGELTYPTLGKRKLIFPTAFGWDILVPRRVNDFICRKKTLNSNISNIYAHEAIC